MKRTRMKHRPRRGDRPDLRDEYRQAHDRCGLCGVRGDRWTALDLHHILGGRFGRKDHPANMLILCRPCHERMNGRQGVALSLGAKARMGELDLGALNAIIASHGTTYRLPEPTL